MAANSDVIVFDASTDEEDASVPQPETQSKKKNSSSDSSSDSDTDRLPNIRSRCTVRRVRSTLRPPLGNKQMDDIPQVSLFGEQTSLYAVKSTRTTEKAAVVDSNTDSEKDDDGDHLDIFSITDKKGKTTTVRRAPQRSVFASEPDCTVIDDDESKTGEGRDHSSTSDVNTSMTNKRDRSPTPPPLSGVHVPLAKRRKARTPRGAKKAMGQLEGLKYRLKTTDRPTTSRSSLEGEDDIVILDESDFPDKQMNIKIRSVIFNKGIERFPMGHTETFERVIRSIAEDEDIPMDQVVLYHKDDPIEIFDTPRSLKLTLADILDCHIMKQASGSSEEEDDELEDIDDPSMVRLKIQGKDKRAAAITIRVKRAIPLEKLMREYAMKCGLNFENLTFMFDGETIHRSETANILEMEDDDCIDVKMS